MKKSQKKKTQTKLKNTWKITYLNKKNIKNDQEGDFVYFLSDCLALLGVAKISSRGEKLIFTFFVYIK
jgi:hypothetical protein